VNEHAPRHKTEENPVYEQIKQFLMESFQTQEADFVPDATLKDLGLDSLDLVELSMEIEQWGARVSDDELSGVRSLAALVMLLEDRGGVVSAA
jgi:acyl carrier protein